MSVTLDFLVIVFGSFKGLQNFNNLSLFNVLAPEGCVFYVILLEK